MTPKGEGEEVVIEVTNSEGTCDITWSSDPPGLVTPDASNNCIGRVTRAEARRIKVEADGWRLVIWVVWAEIEVVPPPQQSPHAQGNFAVWNEIERDGAQAAIGISHHAEILLKATIEPTTIFTDADRPAIKEQTAVEVPGATRKHVITNSPLKYGDREVDRDGKATTDPTRWDMSRQVRVKVLNPNRVTVPPLKAVLGHLHAGQPAAGGAPTTTVPEDYPGSDFQGNGVIGNDDPFNNDEYTNPYEANASPAGALPETEVGQMGSGDMPVIPILHGQPIFHGATVEYRVHFREFVRIVLGSGWVRISDYYPWRVHWKYINNQGNWAHGSHVHAIDNLGWE